MWRSSSNTKKCHLIYWDTNLKELISDLLWHGIGLFYSVQWLICYGWSKLIGFLRIIVRSCAIHELHSETTYFCPSSPSPSFSFLHWWAKAIDYWLPATPLKLNVDGSRISSTDLWACGGLIRNYRGGFVSSFFCNLSWSNSLMAELWGLVNGLKLARNWKPILSI
jgi:hypothetical protein